MYVKIGGNWRAYFCGVPNEILMSRLTQSTPELLAALRQRTEENLALAETYQSLTTNQLTQRPDEGGWSVLECLDHLNHYAAYYLPEIQRAISASRHPAVATFTSSLLGNYFANGMKPGPKMRKIKTFSSADPVNFSNPTDRTALAIFLRDQKEILRLLDQAATVNLTKTKTGISITNWIKLRLGDTLRVVVYHNWRHLEQAQRVLGASQAALVS